MFGDRDYDDLHNILFPESIHRHSYVVGFNQEDPAVLSPECDDMNCANNTDNDKYKIINTHNRINYCDILIEDQTAIFIKENFCCSICNDLLYPPATLNCGHSFCKACLDEYCENEGKNYIFRPISSDIRGQCPLCREQFIINKTKENVSVKKIMNNLSCKCPNHKKNNCKWLGILETLNDHLNKCVLDDSVVVCKWCKLPMELKYFDNHVKNDCKYRKVSCKYCKKNKPWINVGLHEIYCDKRPVECPLCHQFVKYCSMSLHIKSACPFRRIECKYCAHITYAKEIHKHNTQCKKNPISAMVATSKLNKSINDKKISPNDFNKSSYFSLVNKNVIHKEANKFNKHNNAPKKYSQKIKFNNKFMGGRNVCR